MTARRGATGLSGLLVIDKPSGMTSHDVVSYLRRATGERRIGHAGTLDPMATGVLLVLVGSATRLERYLSGHDKSYDARIAFGTETDTLDAEGATTAVHPVPDAVFDAAVASALLARFVGTQAQIPPAYSAIKRDGVPSYRRARAGEDVQMAPRDITVYEAALEAIDPLVGSWDVRFSVSKGTYIRSLARDIGVAAGTGAHLASLRRTAVGALSLHDADSLDDACEAARKGVLPSLFADPVCALGFPVIDGDATIVRSGRPLCAPTAVSIASGGRVSVIVDGRLGAVYQQTPRGCVPETVFVPEVTR